MARILKVSGIFLVGVILGATAMAYLASRASHTYSRSLQVAYSFEQQRTAALAAKDGKWLEAAMAYQNIAAAEYTSDKPFGVKHQDWELIFPLASLVTEPMLRADLYPKGKAVSLSVSQARYAYALEMSGHAAEAAVAWESAMKTGAFKSIETARALATRLLNQDIEFFREH